MSIEYIEQSREKRREHLILNEACIERGGYSTMFKGLLADYLGTEIFTERNILLCHACHNKKCSNPKHLYWGTSKDNKLDQQENGTWKDVWTRRVEKYGLEEALRQQSKGDKSAGGKANRGKPKTEEHKKKIAKSLKRM